MCPGWEKYDGGKSAGNRTDMIELSINNFLEMKLWLMKKEGNLEPLHEGGIIKTDAKEMEKIEII